MAAPINVTIDPTVMSVIANAVTKAVSEQHVIEESKRLNPNLLVCGLVVIVIVAGLVFITWLRKRKS